MKELCHINPFIKQFSGGMSRCPPLSALIWNLVYQIEPHLTQVTDICDENAQVKDGPLDGSTLHPLIL